MMNDKELLRREKIKVRNSLSAAERDFLSSQIVQNVAKNISGKMYIF